MKIKYPTHSRFLAGCELAISENRTALLSGQTISVEFSPHGYYRKAKVVISEEDDSEFETDWRGDYTRFSARINAAALALYKQGLYGEFKMLHDGGLIQITKLLDEQNNTLLKKIMGSQHTDGVRINIAFHDIFNPPESPCYVSKGSSRLIKIQFNGKTFDASYLQEKPTKADRDMQSIRFSKQLKAEFKKVSPDLDGYFSIEIGRTPDEFIFKLIDNQKPEDTEQFAKRFIEQSVPEVDENKLAKARQERLKKNESTAKSSKKKTRTQSVNQSDPVLKEDVKQLYNYKCQLCGTQIKKKGWRKGLPKLDEYNYLSADGHHIVALENGGPDCPSNIICVCPNCHRRLHTGEYVIGFSSDGPYCFRSQDNMAIDIRLQEEHALLHRTEF